MSFRHSGQEPPPQPDFSPVEPGIYSATIVKAEEITAKTGNQMLSLRLQVWAPDGSPKLVFDNLVATEGAAWKTKQFAEALGIDYYAGEIIAEEILQATVTIEVIIKKDQDGKSKNAVKAYLLPKQVDNIKQTAQRDPGTPIQAPAGALAEPVGEDDLPF